MTAKPKIIAIAGTNASGKSAVAVELAKKYNGEIVSADSRQIFRGYDLCSGKVTEEEKKSVPHHLLDISNIDDYFSLSDYQQLAYEKIDAILSCGKLPFVVGGTGLYVRSVVDGYHLAEAAPNGALRAKLEAMATGELLGIITAKEGKIPAYIDVNNRKRLLRACEILLSGKKLGETRGKTPLYDSLQLGITWDIATVRQRIEERLKRRLAENMIAEVQAGLDAGISYEVFYRHGLEFRFIAQYLNGEFESYDDFVEKLKIATGQFAKRQMTWFRKDKSIRWIDMKKDYLQEASMLVDNFLQA